MIYRFETFELDDARFELRRNGERIAIEPQVLSLLQLLVANGDRMVSKDEIVEKVWHSRIISDAAIAARIKSARKAIDDDGQQQRLLRTIHGKGFRFVGEVRFTAPTAPGGIATVLPGDERRTLCTAGRRSPCCLSASSANRGRTRFLPMRLPTN